MARIGWFPSRTFSLYPEPLFGSALRLPLFAALPAGFVGYIPARLVRDPTLDDIVLLAAGAVLYMLAAVTLFERGLRRYSSGSRFGVFG